MTRLQRRPHTIRSGGVTALSPRLLAQRGQAGRVRLSPQLQALSVPEAGVWAVAVPAETEQRRRRGFRGAQRRGWQVAEPGTSLGPGRLVGGSVPQ